MWLKLADISLLLEEGRMDSQTGIVSFGKRALKVTYK